MRTSTSLGRVLVLSAVSAIAPPPGSPPVRHYTQAPPALPPRRAQPRPSRRQDARPPGPAAPPPGPRSPPAPPPRRVPRPPAGPLRPVLRPTVGLLYGVQDLLLPRRAQGLCPAHDPLDGREAPLEVLGDGGSGGEYRPAQLLELGVLRVAQRQPDAAPAERRRERGLPHAPPAQELLDLRRRNGVEPDGPGPGEDRGQHPLAGAGQQHEDGLPLRLLQRLQERVRRLHVQRVRLQNKDPAGALEGTCGGEAQDLPHLPDGREGALWPYLREVRVQPPPGPVLGRRVPPGDERRPEAPGDRPLADPGGPEEQVGVHHLPAGQPVFQKPDGPRVADDAVERVSRPRPAVP